MLRTLLMLLAFIVLIGAVLVWMGIISIPRGGGGIEVNPVNVSVQQRNVALPVPVIERPADTVNTAAPIAAPAPAPAPAPMPADTQ